MDRTSTLLAVSWSWAAAAGILMANDQATYAMCAVAIWNTLYGLALICNRLDKLIEKSK